MLNVLAGAGTGAFLLKTFPQKATETVERFICSFISLIFFIYIIYDKRIHMLFTVGSLVLFLSY